MNEIHFSDMVGRKIFVYTRIAELEKQIAGGQAATATLTGVESGGIWVEHEGLARDLSTAFGVRLSDLPNVTAQVFLPYSSILFVADLRPQLDEESFGLEDSK